MIILADANLNVDYINNTNNKGKYVPVDSDIDAGLIVAGDLNVTNQDFNNNSGNLIVGGTLALKNLENEDGYIYSGYGGVINNLAKASFTNDGEIETANGAILNIEAQNVNLANNLGFTGGGGVIFALNRDNLTVNNDINSAVLLGLKRYGEGNFNFVNNRNINTNNGFYVSATNITNNGNIYSAGDIDLFSTGSVTNNDNKNINTDSNLAILAGADLNNYSNITADGDMILLVDNTVKNYSNNAAKKANIISGGNLIIANQSGDKAGHIYNRWSNIAAGQDMLLKADKIENIGRDYEDGELQTNRIDTGNKAYKNTVLSSYEEIAQSNIYTDYSNITSDANMLIEAARLDNIGGAIYANNNMKLTVNNINNAYNQEYQTNLSSYYSWHDKYKKRGRTRNRGGSYARDDRLTKYYSNNASTIQSGSNEDYEFNLANFEQIANLNAIKHK